MPKQTILVVDDEKDIQKLIQYNLEKEGYTVFLAGTGEAGLELAKARRPDLVILDLMLPGIDGLEVCRLIRSDKLTQSVPILMLTAKNSEIDQVVGLEMGAADYIGKPFSPKVLLARVKNIFRKEQPKDEGGNLIRSSEMEIDRECQRLTVKGKPVALTRLEFRILFFLMQNQDRVFSRDQLLSGAWGGEAFVVDRTVDVHVRSIRKKLGKYRDCIETVRGTGYRFVKMD
jgi:DNA-binding response OmpR family regulator